MIRKIFFIPWKYGNTGTEKFINKKRRICSLKEQTALGIIVIISLMAVSCSTSTDQIKAGEEKSEQSLSVAPIEDVTGNENKSFTISRTAYGWYIFAPSGISAYVKGFEDGIFCRIPEGWKQRDRYGRNKDWELVQLGIGPATSSFCNAIYSPGQDLALEFDGDNFLIEPVVKGGKVHHIKISCTGPLSVTEHRNYFRIEKGISHFTPLDKSRFPHPPSGWCSWYYYYSRITEADLIRNTDWLAANLKQFGCEWVQIDDGWQGNSTTGNWGRNRDWFLTNDKKFPNGMKYCADYIRSKGLRPGIWLMPFSQSSEKLFAENPAMFVRNTDGSSVGERSEPFPMEWWWRKENHEGKDIYTTWPGRYIIDPTNKDSQQYLRDLFKMVCHNWGYDYVKADGQIYSMQLMAHGREKFADPSLNSELAYRKGLETITSVMGKERFLLNCGGNYSSVGYCQGIRTGGDVSLKWEEMINGFGATMKFLYLNTIAFYTDPDVVCVREPLQYERARLWTTLLGITGQLLMASDDMPALPEERVELLRRIYPVADIHPMELYDLDDKRMPGIFDLKIRKVELPGWDVVALFNWSETDSKTYKLSPRRLGLSGSSWLCMDGYTGTLIPDEGGNVEIVVPPASSRIISYWPDYERPQFLGTNRHITQGAVDVLSISWDEKTLKLRGSSLAVGGDPYKIRIYVPEGFRIISPETVKQQGNLAEYIIQQNSNQEINWEFQFARNQQF